MDLSLGQNKDNHLDKNEKNNIITLQIPKFSAEVDESSSDDSERQRSNMTP